MLVLASYETLTMSTGSSNIDGGDSDKNRRFGYWSDDTMRPFVDIVADSKVPSENKDKYLLLKFVLVMSDCICILESWMKQTDTSILEQESVNQVLLNHSRWTLAIVQTLRDGSFKDNDTVVRRHKCSESCNY